MHSFNVEPLIKALIAVILFSISIGQFSKLRDFAIREGVRAVTMKDYRPPISRFQSIRADFFGAGINRWLGLRQ